jgi:serine/threonine protein kinase
MLLSSIDFLKITDFGLSKLSTKNEKNTTNTQCKYSSLLRRNTIIFGTGDNKRRGL